MRVPTCTHEENKAILSLFPPLYYATKYAKNHPFSLFLAVFRCFCAFFWSFWGVFCLKNTLKIALFLPYFCPFCAPKSPFFDPKIALFLPLFSPLFCPFFDRFCAPPNTPKNALFLTSKSPIFAVKIVQNRPLLTAFTRRVCVRANRLFLRDSDRF